MEFKMGTLEGTTWTSLARKDINPDLSRGKNADPALKV